MLLLETGIFYLLIGSGVAVAVYLRDDAAPQLVRGFRVVTACLFWPLYVPLLLAPSENRVPPAGDGPAVAEHNQKDELATAISQVETELDAALQSLDGWAENVLALEQDRLTELRTAWRGQADRIRELDKLLARPESRIDPLAQTAACNERVRQSEQVRRENIRRLEQLRQQLHADFVGTLAWVREVATMIHVAKFTGAPASRAEELVAQLAAAVEGLTEVSAWQTPQEALPC